MTRQSDPGMGSDGKLSPRESQYLGDGSLWRRRGAGTGASVVTEPSPCERLLTRGGGRRRGLPRGRGAGLSGCDRWNSSVRVGSRISPEFTQKKVAKSSAVIDMVGGGEGGQRRELNVLKRLCISGALLILLWKCDDLAVWTSAEKDERNN